MLPISLSRVKISLFRHTLDFFYSLEAASNSQSNRSYLFVAPPVSCTASCETPRRRLAQARKPRRHQQDRILFAFEDYLQRVDVTGRCV